MSPNRLAALCLLAACTALTSLAATAVRPASPPARPQTDLPTVYLADFELRAVAAQPLRRAANPDSSQASDDEPATQARRLVEFLSLSLTEALTKAGYSVQFFPPPNGHPDRGVLMQGVFTEPDEYNRVRRAIYGSGSKSAKFVVYVGVTNLAHPDQPLYEVIRPGTPGFPMDSRFGPLITITSYSPVTSFELGRSPTDDDIRKMASDIADRLSALVAANPALTK